VIVPFITYTGRSHQIVPVEGVPSFVEMSFVTELFFRGLWAFFLRLGGATRTNMYFSFLPSHDAESLYDPIYKFPPHFLWLFLF